MSDPHIVIVTDFMDAHADVIVKRLAVLGHDCVRVNTSDLPMAAVLSATLGPDAGTPGWTGSLRVTTNGRALRWHDVTAVWWRRPGGFGLPPELSAWEREFAQEELSHAFGGLWSALDCYWMSRPQDIAAAGYKLEQLARARRMGFDIPRTLVSNDGAVVREFRDSCGAGMVFKVLTDPFLMARQTVERDHDADVDLRFVSTTLVTDELAAGLDESLTIPCLFQELVERRTEKRVTIIGDDLCVAEPDAAAVRPGAVDWRQAFADQVPYRASTVPDDVAERCMSLVRSYGLQFSAIDLLVTPDGRHVFLENNPNGQFLFLDEQVPELRLADALTSRLLRGVL